MIETFTLKHFRCFKNTSISPLSRINLIMGRNNSGKTAFLEGVFLHLGGTNPELPININIFRGIVKLVPNAHEVWGWLFHDKLTTEPIHLISYDVNGDKRELVVTLEPLRSSEIAKENEALDKPQHEFVSTISASNQQLSLVFRDPNGSEYRVGARFSKKQIIFSRDNKAEIPFSTSIFMATHIRNHVEDTERYSRLEQSGLHGPIIETMKQIEPKLKRFVVSISTGIPALHADLGGTKLIPLSYMGEGVKRLLSIALALPICQNGTLLIDEIENGIHHSNLITVFRAIHSLAEKFNVQLLATTHSWDCIHAVHEVYEKTNVYDFRLFEFEKGTGGADDFTVKAYNQDMIKSSLNRKTIL